MLDRADIDQKRRFMNDTKKVEDGQGTDQDESKAAANASTDEGGSKGDAGEGQEVTENKGGEDTDAANETSAE